MAEVTEHTIERYVRYPESFSEAERQAVEEAIRKDKLLRDIADFYRAFYEELDTLGEDLPPDVETRTRDILHSDRGEGEAER